MATKARIQRFRRAQVAHMVTRERAALPCGCAIYVGRTGDGTATTGAIPCSIEHEPVTDRSSGLLREMSVKPGRLLVEACKHALEQAAKEMGL